MKTLLLFCFCSIALLSRGQGSMAANGDPVTFRYTSFNGSPFLAQTLDVIEGTPYFTSVSAWLKGTAIFNNDARSTPFVGRLNLLNGKLHYLNEANLEFVAVPNLKEIWLTDTVTNARYHFVLPVDAAQNRDIKANWWQVLVTDSAALTLYKATSLRVQESHGYNTAPQKRITTADHYLLRKGSRTVPVSKVKDIAAAFPEYEKPIADFVAAQPFSKRASVELQLQTVAAHLNTLRR